MGTSASLPVPSSPAFLCHHGDTLTPIRTADGWADGRRGWMEKKRDGRKDGCHFLHVNQPPRLSLGSLFLSLVLRSSAPYGPVTLCCVSCDTCPAQPSCQVLSSPADLGVGLGVGLGRADLGVGVGQGGTMCLCLSVDSFEIARIPPLLVLLTWTLLLL